jgi:ABC-type transporter lipoprotein component MlaA
MTDNKHVDAVDEKMADTEFKEVAVGYQHITPRMIQARFETLKDLNEEEMAALNKRLVRRLDWRLMPCITLMFLMK